jgi:hypothetical protein
MAGGLAMNSEKLFSAKIAGFAAGGIALAAGLATFLDSRLTTHLLFGPREYPMGYWVLLIGPVLFFGMYFLSLLPKSTGKRIVLPLVFLLAVGCLSFLNFLPEFPHANVGVSLLLYFVGVTMSIWIRHSPLRTDYINETDIFVQARLERVKETVILWRTLLLSLSAGFLALLIPWFVFIWDVPAKIVTEPREQILLGFASGAQVSLFSLFFISCPLFETIRKYGAAADMLLRLKETNMAKDKASEPARE